MTPLRIPAPFWPRLDEPSEVPLLPRDLLEFLGTQLGRSVLHLSADGDHSSSTPHPLLLLKFFTIVCRWGQAPSLPLTAG